MTASGFYHCSVKSVGRANGRSIVAAAAYRSGEQLMDERTGEIADYRARGGVLDSFIIAPDNAPAWVQARTWLWNGAEAAEHRANGRLATELELALPHELTAAQQHELLKDFLAPIIERYGVAADVAIHEPGEGRDHRNIHAHVLITNRRLDEHGFIEKEKGQRKDIGLSGFAMGSEAVTEIRKEWEQHVNRAYERAGLDIEVDHRSHKDRGIGQEPTRHLGPEASAMERRGIASELGDANREIMTRNAMHRAARELEKEAAAVRAEIIAAKAELAAEEVMQRAHAVVQGRRDEIKPDRSAEIDRQAEQAMQAARNAAAGRTDDIRPASNQNTREQMTLEVVARDPWKAVDLALPRDADPVLLATVALCAEQCAAAAFAHGRVAVVVKPEQAEYYRARHDRAAERRDEVRQMIADLPPEQRTVTPFPHPEMQETALLNVSGGYIDGPTAPPRSVITAAEIDKNPWHVLSCNVTGASPELLNRVIDTAEGLREEALRRRDEASYTPQEKYLWDYLAVEATDTVKNAQIERGLTGTFAFSEMERPASAPAREADQAIQDAHAAAKGRRDEIGPATQPEQTMQEAWAAAKGRVDDVRPPIFDRDAASRLADEKIIDAAIAADQAMRGAHAAAKGRVDDIRPKRVGTREHARQRAGKWPGRGVGGAAGLCRRAGASQGRQAP